MIPIKWPSLSAREKDALVAEKVMGWVLDDDGCWWDGDNEPMNSQEFTKTWKGMGLIIEKMHEKHPGWRFSLLGGDTRLGNRCFGWNAEFFGHEDPAKNFGQRHGECHYYSTAPEAVAIAALRAKGIEIEQ